AGYGLVGNSLRLPLDAKDWPNCGALAAALVTLGPVFSSFGIYLASRTDLFTARNCLELAGIPDRAEPMPIDLVRDVIRQEIGQSPSEIYSVFEEEPFETRLMSQSHRAWLGNDQAVKVKIVRPEFEEQLACDVQSLPRLASAFVSDGGAGLC